MLLQRHIFGGDGFVVETLPITKESGVMEAVQTPHRQLKLFHIENPLSMQLGGARLRECERSSHSTELNYGMSYDDVTNVICYVDSQCLVRSFTGFNLIHSSSSSCILSIDKVTLTSLMKAWQRVRHVLAMVPLNVQIVVVVERRTLVLSSPATSSANSATVQGEKSAASVAAGAQFYDPVLTERDHMHSQLSTLKWMDIILGPFKLLYSVIGTVLLITGYSIVFLIQALCFSARGNRDGIIEAFGWYGRSVINAVAKVFE